MPLGPNQAFTFTLISSESVFGGVSVLRTGRDCVSSVPGDCEWMDPLSVQLKQQ